MISPWLKANVVRVATKASTIVALPPIKIADAFKYCPQEILDGVEENIRHAVQTLRNPKFYAKNSFERKRQLCMTGRFHPIFPPLHMFLTKYRPRRLQSIFQAMKEYGV